MRPDAVLFDLGDTLIDLGEGRGSYEERLEARVGRVYDVLAERNLRLPNRDEFCTALATDSEALYRAALAEQAGISIFEVMRRLLASHGVEPDDLAIDAASDAYCTGGQLVPAGLRPGAIETLRSLRGWGVRIGVISNTVQPARFMTPSLVSRGLAEFVQVQLYSSDVGVAKPHPAIFRMALDALDAEPQNSAYVGDRLEADVGGAQAAGMKGILIEVGHRVETHERIVPDARIKELPELPAALQRLFFIDG